MNKEVTPQVEQSVPETDAVATTASEAGKRGGNAVKALYGKDFYAQIGQKGGSTTRARYGADFYGAIGKKGGQSTMAKHGSEFFGEIGKKGGNRVKELIELGKQVQG